MQEPSEICLKPCLHVYFVVPLQSALAGHFLHFPSLISLFGQAQEIVPSAFLVSVNPFVVSQVTFTPLHLPWLGQAVHLLPTKYLLPLQAHVTAPFLPATASYPTLQVTLAVPLQVALAGQAVHVLSVKRYCDFVHVAIQLPFLSFSYPALQVYVVVPLHSALAGQATHFCLLCIYRRHKYKQLLLLLHW